MKLRHAALVSAALLAIPPSSAQIRPQPFTIPEALHYLDNLSRVYLDRFSSRLGPATYPTEADYMAVRFNLSTVMNWLKLEPAADNNVALPLAESNGIENKNLITSALKCQDCQKPISGATPDSLPMNVGQMKMLLVSRLLMIQSIIPSSGRLTNDEIIQLETQLTYLRRIVIAYRV
jgi:hypothetical protein